MSGQKESVLYEFRGDVTSLRKATNDAIGTLDKFQDRMNKLNSEGMVKASQRAQTGFQNSVNRMVKGVTAVEKKLKSVGDVRIPRGTEAFQTTEQAAKTLDSILNRLNSSNTITSKSLNAMKAELNTVTAALKGAGPSFDTLVAKEEKFQQRLANIGNVANQFSSQIRGAFSTVSTYVDSKISAIGNYFAPLVSKIQGFKDKAVIAGNRVAQVFATVTAAFRRTSDGTEGASRSQSRLGKILDSVREKFNKHKKELDDVEDGYEDVEKASEKASSAMSSGATGALSALGSLKNIARGIVDSFFALAGVDLGNLLSEGAKGAINYVENLNLFRVAMGSSVEKGEAFVKQMQEVYGMDPSNIYRYAGYFNQLTDAIGMNSEASSIMSLSMTKMSNDLASLFNVDVQTVVEDLASGIQGMTRTVRKYGMDVRTTTLQQTAMKYGIEGNVDSMTEANRQALRYITMLEQAQNALRQTTDAVDGTTEELGDFARNIETPANQLRIFKEQISQLGRAIGTFIVAPLQKVLPYINGFIMSLRVVINFLATLKGVAIDAGNSLSSAGDSADNIDSIGDAADKTSKKLKQLIAPFDELNVFQESSGSEDSLLSDDALDPALAKAISEMELNLENISMKANKVRDAILGFLGLEVTTDPITGEQIIQWDKEAFMGNVMDSLDKFKEWFADLSPIAKGALTIAGLVSAFSTLKGVMLAVSAVPTILTTAFSFLGTILTTLTSPIALIIGALSLLLIFSEDFRAAFVGLFTKIGESFFEWGNTLSGVFSTVGNDLVTMWATYIQPTIEAIGSMLAPALETLGSLWQNLSTIINGVFTLIGDLWTHVLKPVIEFALDIIQDLCEIIQTLWEAFLGPIIERICNTVERMWTSYLQPIIHKILKIIGNVIEILQVLWNTVLAPIAKFLVDVLAPVFRAVFQGIWSWVEWAISLILDIIDTLLGVFGGVIEFLAGVFTLDWRKALSGLLNIFVALGNGIIGAIEGALNLCIGIINSWIAAIVGAIKGLINGLGDLVEGIASFLGFDLDLSVNWSIPQIPQLSIPRIPEVALASGGVVTGPTRALIGEGKYSEAVLPLDDSPQMNDLINKIVEAINKDDPEPQPVEVKVYIGDKEYDAYTYKASERGRKIVGKQPIKIGG